MPVLNNILVVLIMVSFSSCTESEAGNFGSGTVNMDLSLFAGSGKTEHQFIRKNEKKVESVPIENMARSFSPPLPDVDSEEHFRVFLNSISKGNSDIPDIKVPFNIFSKIWKFDDSDNSMSRKIYSTMTAKFRKWVTKISNTGILANSTFESFELGKCAWNNPGENLARYGYWLCKNPVIYHHQGATRKVLKLPPVLNWGKKWYFLFR
ncbi:MAG: hypothetical protein JXR95_06570 [Deltaproteobacteria bacterium]|nr:hypothetical protein [Deltaproteobacteria bacterium]